MTKPDPRSVFGAMFPRSMRPQDLPPDEQTALAQFMVGEPVSEAQRHMVDELVRCGVSFHPITEEDLT